MDEVSETESQGRISKLDEDGSTIPAIITDEYFDEISSKCQAVGFKKINSILKQIRADKKRKLRDYLFKLFILNFRESLRRYGVY